MTSSPAGSQDPNNPDPYRKRAAENLEIPIAGMLPGWLFSGHPGVPEFPNFPSFADLVATPYTVRLKNRALLEFLGAELVALGSDATISDIMTSADKWLDFIKVNIGNANPVVPWLDPARKFLCRCGKYVYARQVHACEYTQDNGTSSAAEGGRH